MHVEKILDKLGVFYDDIAKERHGSCPKIIWGDLISRIYFNKGSCRTSDLFPEIGQQTFNRMMKKHFPNRINGGGQSWYFYLLSIVEHKLCKLCDRELPFSGYHKNTGGSSVNLSSKCRKCTSEYQKNHHITYAESFKKSQEKNYSSILARNAKYRAERNLRIPGWFSFQEEEIKKFYENCPEGFHVDHIIPLKGKNVSGLHVIQNLQYLSANANIVKGNKFDIE